MPSSWLFWLLLRTKHVERTTIHFGFDLCCLKQTGWQLCSIKLSERQSWIFKTTLNLLVFVFFSECFRLCPKICGDRCFSFLPLPTMIGYDKTCQEKNGFILQTISLHGNSEESSGGTWTLKFDQGKWHEYARQVVLNYWDFRRENFQLEVVVCTICKKMYKHL